MNYDIYLPQTPNVFDEGDYEKGIWLRSCDDMDANMIESIVQARMRSIGTLGDDGSIDLVIRAYRG